MLRELISGFRSLSIIGMCKNAGKTTVLNRMIYELRSAGVRLALTSIGRDGESTDVVTGTSKPGIYIYEGTIIATASDMLAMCDITKEVLSSTGFSTPLGEVAVLRARSDGLVQLAGPSMTAQLAALTEIFESFGADMTIIDGAISRKTLCAPAVSEATVLCTGASYSRDINAVVNDTAFAAELLTLPLQTLWSREEIDSPGAPKLRFKMEDGTTRALPDSLRLADALRMREYAGVKGIFVLGAVTAALLKPVLQGGADIRNVEIAALDGSKLLFDRGIREKLAIRGARLAVAHPVRVAAITVNPVSAYGFDMDGDELLSRMKELTGLPVVNVRADGEDMII